MIVGDSRGKGISEKQPPGNTRQSEIVLGNNEYNKAGASQGNFWSPSAVRHSQSVRLIREDGSVRYNTINI